MKDVAFPEVTLNAKAQEFQLRRKTKPLTREEVDALQEYVFSPEKDIEIGLKITDFDIETIDLLEARSEGRLPPKKLIKRQKEVWHQRCIERKAFLKELGLRINS